MPVRGTGAGAAAGAGAGAGAALAGTTTTSDLAVVHALPISMCVKKGCRYKVVK